MALTPGETLRAYWETFEGAAGVGTSRMICPLPSLPTVALAGGNLVQFGVMIERVTGKPALQYNDYGCYCGVGGSHWPVDPTDWCCHAHDCCYGRVEKLGCEPKLERYLFSASRHNIFCAGRTTCQRQTCECDRRAALCFRHNLDTYNRSYVRYPNKLCSGPTPPC
ncbi:group IIE secretory phospholipase A2-like [Panthera uncia]|uniref:group IIE secretory phospholipase A2-like n=1 Tax=Panthera uncia TaxID=29064 RepID=UPI0020FFF3CC|nr:group IIE secretory phospholipase A2-like [Panthera uncia]